MSLTHHDLLRLQQARAFLWFRRVCYFLGSWFLLANLYWFYQQNFNAPWGSIFP